MASRFFQFLAEPRPLHALLGLYAIAALGFALVSQYFFDLHPCELCIYQRIPLAAVIGVSIFALLIRNAGLPALFIQAALFITEAAIAFFHTGVERKWWGSGCSSLSVEGTVEEMMERIKNAPAVKCDDIPWEMFGLSMANYNVILSVAIVGVLAHAIIKAGSPPRV